jgi:hypothetical protein
LYKKNLSKKDRSNYKTLSQPVVNASLHLGFFEKIKEAGLPGISVGALAALSTATVRGAQVLLDALTAMDLTRRTHDGRYILGPASAHFLVPGARWDWSSMLLGDSLSDPTAKLVAAVTKNVAFGAVEEWEAGKLTPERAQSLTARFHAHSLPAAIGAAAAVDFSGLGVKKMIDIGGGSGAYAIAIARAHPDVVVEVMDLPVVCNVTAKYVGEAGVSDRVLCMPLDFFREDFPRPDQGYNAAFLSNILHDWDDETSVKLLKKTWHSLPKGGLVFLHEQLIDEGRQGPLTTTLFSVHMLLYTRGVQRTASELKTILGEAGFHWRGVVPAYGYYSVVIAEKTTSGQ